MGFALTSGVKIILRRARVLLSLLILSLPLIYPSLAAADVKIEIKFPSTSLSLEAEGDLLRLKFSGRNQSARHWFGSKFLSLEILPSTTRSSLGKRLLRFKVKMLNPGGREVLRIFELEENGDRTELNEPRSHLREAPPEDPYLWLEEVEGREATKWAERETERSNSALTSHPVYAPVKAEALSILTDPDRTVFPSLPDENGYVWNFWTDAQNPRGLLRRMKEVDFKNNSKAWELVLDIDALNKQEGKSYVFKGTERLRGSARAIILLSPAGSDATEAREFDFETKSFVKEGFFLPEAKMAVAWLDENKLLVATDFGAGSLTKSGYPRFLKIWSRGQSLENAEKVFEVGTDDMGLAAEILRRPEGKIIFFERRIDFYRAEKFVFSEGTLPQKISLPEKSHILDVFGDYFFVALKEDWILDAKTYKSGSLIAIPKAEILNPKSETILQIFVPNERQALSEFSAGKEEAFLAISDNIASRLFRLKKGSAGEFVQTEIALPPLMALSDLDADPFSERASFEILGFTNPSSYFDLERAGDEFKLLRSEKAYFDSSRFVVEQFEATSKDGTKIPYSLVRSKEMKFDGSQVVLMRGYGGFQVPENPAYLGLLGKTLLERGFAYVQTNIRGGGEFGPSWHEAAIREKKQNSYDDFIGIAEDLFARGITSKEKLAIKGGSNGGLLMGAVMTQRPELFGAVIIQVPLLDMKRYVHLPAGDSWKAEYGDPDLPSDWEFISQYSPYQNLSMLLDYPPTLIATSRKDDRVHPGHARKYAIRMTEFGSRPFYHENPEGGHAGAADHEQAAHMRALECAFLFKSLVD